MWGDLWRRPLPAAGTRPLRLPGRRARVRCRVGSILPCLSECLESVLPQIVPAALAGNWLGHRRSLLTLPYGEGLRLAFVLDGEHGYRFITQETAVAWGLDAREALHRAVANLKRRTPRMPWKRLGQGPRTRFLCETFDGYDAVRVLLRAELEALRRELAGDLVLAIPSRDLLIVAGDADPNTVKHVASTAEEVFRSARYRVSRRLFTLGAEHLEPYRIVPNEVRFSH